MERGRFPKDFLWGASTAAHQIEGGTHNQWSEWEKANAQRLAQTASERLSWLPNWKEIEPQATNPENYISGNGVEHFTRYKEDFTLLKQLNMNTFRFSIEWSRLEPIEGEWDVQAVEHYRQYIAELHRLNIEPIVTLWHWTVPVWFANKGGFEKHANLHYFERFVEKVGQEYGATIRYVLTLNEPNTYAAISYINGDWPPQQKSLVKFLCVYTNLVAVHRRAYAIIKRRNPSIQIGVTMNTANGRPKNPHNPVSVVAAMVANYTWNRWFLNRIKKQQDFIGLNYYNTDYYQNLRKHNPKTPLNDMGWYMEPSGLGPVLEETWRQYRLPIIIIENGLADAKDAYRKWWIEETLSAIELSLAKGINVHGYMHWSLLDNFEWDSGWWPKFGLLAVDRKTMRRTIRPSAAWFGGWLGKK